MERDVCEYCRVHCFGTCNFALVEKNILKRLSDPEGEITKAERPVCEQCNGFKNISSGLGYRIFCNRCYGSKERENSKHVCLTVGCEKNGFNNQLLETTGDEPNCSSCGEHMYTVSKES